MSNLLNATGQKIDSQSIRSSGGGEVSPEGRTKKRAVSELRETFPKKGRKGLVRHKKSSLKATKNKD